MPPRTRRSVISAPIPQGANENSNPMRNTTRTQGSGQQQVTPGVSAAKGAAGTGPARKLPVLLEI